MINVTSVSKQVGKKIRKIREEKGKTQEQLSLDSGLNRAYIGYIERGERNPSTNTLMKIAKALRTPLHELLK